MYRKLRENRRQSEQSEVRSLREDIEDKIFQPLCVLVPLIYLFRARQRELHEAARVSPSLQGTKRRETRHKPKIRIQKRAVTRHHQGQSANSSDDRHVVGSRSLHQVRWRHVSGVLVDNI